MADDTRWEPAMRRVEGSLSGGTLNMVEDTSAATSLSLERLVVDGPPEDEKSPADARPFTISLFHRN